MSLFTRTKYITLTRRNTDIVLPEDVYTKIQKKGYNISLVKNGNNCDFHKSNVIK